MKHITDFFPDRTCQECIHKRPCGHLTYFLRIIREENNKNPILESSAIEPLISQMAMACVEYLDKKMVIMEK